MAGDTAQVHDLTELRPQEIPALRTLRGPSRSAGPRSSARSPRSCGRGPASSSTVAGIGKKAIARAVIRELSHDAVRGVELRPRLSQENTLTTLYEQLVSVFFHVSVTDPAEEQLWTAARGIVALVVIYDCELPADQVGRLLATFLAVFVLLTSQHLAYQPGCQFRQAIEPLDRRSALTLVTQELGHDTAGLQRAQAEQACDLAAGQVQRLLLYAAFLRSTEWWPGHRPLPELTVAEVATVLAGGLSEPARQVLVVLATFGAGVPPDLFTAVAGLRPLRPGGDLAVAAELLTARLVTEQGSEISITADANAAVRSTW